MLNRCLFTLILAFVHVCDLGAQTLGTQFTWQGELRDAGVPATGAYDLEFRLHAGSTGGSPLGPPNSFPAQDLTGGVHSVVLDFGDQFTGAPRWLEIAVRRSGQPSFTVLSPRTLLTASPYALHAEFVGDNSVVSANIVDGSVTASDLGVGSVGSPQIVNASILGADLADGSVTTVKIADAAVTAAKLATNAVGSAQINPSQVQVRVSVRCPVGLPLIGMDADGMPICSDSSALIEATSATWPRLALRPDGRPVIAFVDSANDDLLLASCGDSNCSTHTVELLDSTAGDPGDAVAVGVRSSGRPFVVYRDGAADALHAFDCADERCEARNFRVLDATAGAGHGVSLAVRSGDIPIVSYRVGGSEIRAYDCDNTNCTSGTARSLASVDVDGSSATALVLALGDISTVFFEGSNGLDGLNAYNCLNPACSSGGRVDLNSIDVGRMRAVARTTSPLLAYSTATGGISLFACNGTLGLCPSGASQQIFGPGDVGALAAVDIGRDENQDAYVVAYSDDELTIRDCATDTCSSFFTRTPDPVTGRGEHPSFAVRVDGRPVLAYEDAGSIRVLVCGNVGCAP